MPRPHSCEIPRPCRAPADFFPIPAGPRSTHPHPCRPLVPTIAWMIIMMNIMRNWQVVWCCQTWSHPSCCLYHTDQCLHVLTYKCTNASLGSSSAHQHVPACVQTPRCYLAPGTSQATPAASGTSDHPREQSKHHVLVVIIRNSAADDLNMHGSSVAARLLHRVQIIKVPLYIQLQLLHFLVNFYNFYAIANRNEYSTTTCNLLT